MGGGGFSGVVIAAAEFWEGFDETEEVAGATAGAVATTWASGGKDETIPVCGVSLVEVAVLRIVLLRYFGH